MKNENNIKSQNTVHETSVSADEQAVKKNKRRKRSVLTFVIVIFLVSAVITFICCWSVSMAGKLIEIEEESSEKARTVADIVNDIYSSGMLLGVNPMVPEEEPLQRYYPPLSEKRKEMLSTLCNSFGFKYLYVFSLNEQKSEYTYLFVVSSDKELNKVVEETRPFGTTVHVDKVPEAVIAAAHGQVDNTIWEDDNEYGKTYCWAYPLALNDVDDDEYEDYLVIGAEFDVSDINSNVAMRALIISLPIILILLLNLLVLLIILRNKILKPIADISVKMNSFADGENISHEHLDMKKNDEIGEIANSFDKMTDDIRSYITNINDLTTYRVQASTQMEIAERIQYGIVPEKTELHEKGVNAYAIEKPAKLIGGDFYDCFILDDNYLCMVMGDVSGKGITAALFMVMVKTALREKLLSGMDPAEALNVVNDDVCMSNPEGMFATVFAAVLNTNTGLLRYANAGHTAPVIIDGKPVFFRPDAGTAIGLFEDIGIIEGAMLMSKGEGIVLYTDGVTEAVDPDDNFYGEDRVLSVLEGAKDSAAATEALRGSIISFYNGREQFDDLTILSAFYEDNEKRLILRPDLEEQDRINDLIMSEAAGCDKLKKIILACEELFANIVSYSGADEIVFFCTKKNDSLIVELIDNGKSFDPINEAPAEKDFDEYDTGGMGIAIVKQIAYRIKYKRAGSYNCLRLRIKIDN